MYARAGWALIAVALVALPPTALARDKGGDKGKPDLVVKDAEILPEADPAHIVVETDGSAEYSFRVKTKNRGDETVGKSKTELFFTKIRVFNPEKNFEPKLKPQQVGRLEHGDADAETIRQPSAPTLGLYAWLVCADFRDAIAESNERNNCKAGTVAVIARRWAVDFLVGQVALEGVTQRSSASGFDFVFQGVGENADGKFFVYGPEPTPTISGLVFGTDSGGCAWDGRGDAQALESIFQIRSDLDFYYANAMNLSDRYPATVTCPDAEPFPTSLFFTPAFTYGGGEFPPMQPDAYVLFGFHQYTNSDTGALFTHDWRLSARAP